MSEPFLYIDKIMKNPDLTIRFALPTGPVTAFMTSDTFDVSGTATYNSLLEESLAEMAVGAIAGNKGKSIMKMATAATQTKVMSPLETTLSWSGSERPEFSLELTFVSIRGEDVREYAKKFLEGTMPKSWSGTTMKAPWGYSLLTKDAGGGKFAVSIGRWFRAPNQVLKSASFRLSTLCNQNGHPLYAIGTISFAPYRLLSAPQFLSYFS